MIIRNDAESVTSQ